MLFNKRKENRGQALMVNMLLFFMAAAFLVSILPAFNELISYAQQSDSLNCKGYKYDGNENHTLSYNSSLATSTISCLSIRFYVPYLILAVLVGGVAKLLSNKVESGIVAQAPY